MKYITDTYYTISVLNAGDQNRTGEFLRNHRKQVQAMQDGGQWLTVREFAAAAGVSIQAVYQRLDKDLSSYLKSEKGRKYINSDALQFVGNSSTCQADSSTCQVLDKDLKTLAEQLDAARLTISEQAAALDDLRAELATVRAQMLDAETRAAAAAARADAESRRADESNAALVSALDAVKAAQQHADTLATALTAAQALHAGQMRLQMNDTQSAGDGEPETEKPRGIIARIFRRRKEKD